MTSSKTMPTPDDDAFNERLERALPRLLVDHPYDFQQDLEEFRSEEAFLDAEIDRIWEQVVEEEIPIVITERPKSSIQPKVWMGGLAASLIVGLGVTALITLGHSTPNASTLRSAQATAGQDALAQALQQQWKPKVTVRATRDIILSTKVAPGNPRKIEVELLQSSGDKEVDLQALKTASTASFYKLTGQNLPASYTLNFNLRSGKVSVQQK